MTSNINSIHTGVDIDRFIGERQSGAAALHRDLATAMFACATSEQ